MSAITKGDKILYHFGFRTQEAKVIQVFSNGYLKVRHNDFLCFGFRDVIHESEVLAVKNRTS